ncbi:unnamed protein product [Spirodela intermedia]|uniref:Uncharacterized protein n=1 Tax=Spirodela intermedia TaxID=51605 RepID=A0A7I8INR0_SPIIN|nr:unnamed protein product [Spirodela intermedia]CAA6659605.1 unnamed protein product [Spirodela intermedia]
MGKPVVTEILPARRFYRGAKQSARKGCNDPIRCYG